MGLDGELLKTNLAVLLAGLIVLGVIGVVLYHLLAWVVQTIGRIRVRDEGYLLGDERIVQITSQMRRVVRLVFGLGTVGLIGWFAYLTVAAIDAYGQIWQFAQSWTWDSVQPAVLMLAQFVAALILLRSIGWLGKLFSQWLVEALQNAAIVRVEDERVARFGRRLSGLFRALLWYFGVMVAVDIFNLSDVAGHATLMIVEFVLIYALVRLLAVAVATAADSIYEGLGEKWQADDNPVIDNIEQFRGVNERIKSGLQWAVYVAAGTYLVSRVTFGGVMVGEKSLEAILYSIAIAAAKVIGLWITAMLVVEISAVLIYHFALQAKDPDQIPERRRTIVPLMVSLLRYLVYFVAAVMSLNAIGVDTTAILAGAGIVGIAVGFGAQNMVRDLVSGFFILFEGYFWVGDRIDIGAERGVVEAITLRTTWLRAPDGTLQVVPNGEITTVVNYSRDFVHAIVEVGVSYEGDLEYALKVTEEAMTQLGEENPDVTGPPTVMVNKFNDSSINLLIRLPVEPAQNWAVASEMRRRLKAVYDEHGIEIPFPRQVLMFQTGSGEQVDEIPLSFDAAQWQHFPAEVEPKSL